MRHKSKHQTVSVDLCWGGETIPFCSAGTYQFLPSTLQTLKPTHKRAHTNFAAGVSCLLLVRSLESTCSVPTCSLTQFHDALMNKDTHTCTRCLCRVIQWFKYATIHSSSNDLTCLNKTMSPSSPSSDLLSHHGVTPQC